MLGKDFKSKAEPVVALPNAQVANLVSEQKIHRFGAKELLPVEFAAVEQHLAEPGIIFDRTDEAGAARKVCFGPLNRKVAVVKVS